MIEYDIVGRTRCQCCQAGNVQGRSLRDSATSIDGERTCTHCNVTQLDRIRIANGNIARTAIAQADCAYEVIKRIVQGNGISTGIKARCTRDGQGRILGDGTVGIDGKAAGADINGTQLNGIGIGNRDRVVAAVAQADRTGKVVCQIQCNGISTGIKAGGASNIEYAALADACTGDIQVAADDAGLQIKCGGIDKSDVVQRAC